MSNVTDFMKADPVKTGLFGLGLGSAFLGGEPEQLDNEPTIAPRKPLEFTGHEAKGPFTEQQLVDLALGRETFDEDGNPIDYDLFTPGRGEGGSWYVSKNEGGLVGIPQTKQRSNVTNYMFDKKQGAVSPFNIFEVGKGLGSMGKKNNSTLMQLATGGQPRSNVADMITPMSRPVEFPRMISPSVFSYDNLLNKAAEKEEVEGFESPDAYQKRHEEIIEKLLEDMKNISTILPEEDEEPVVAAAEPLIQEPDDSTFADGNPDAADEEDAADAAAAAAEAAEAAAEAEAEGVDEAAGPDDAYARGGIIGLAKGGKLEYYDEAFDSLYKLGVKFPELESMLAGETESSLPLEQRLRRVNPKSKATGLFQFIPKTAKELGTTTSKIKNMSAKEQADLYAKYLKKYKWKPGVPLGMMQAAPSMANKPDDHIVYKKGSKAYKQNPNWVGPDGEIRVESIKKYYDPNYNVKPEEESDSSSGLLEMLQNLFTSQDDNTITISEGDTLFDISKKYGIPLPEILQKNPSITDPNFIRKGQVINKYQGGSVNPYFEGQVIGKGDGQSDQILFEVEGKNPDMALLSRDEYVLPADAVAMLGNGSSNAGAKELDQFVKNLRQQSFGTQQQQTKIKSPERIVSISIV